jgi:hypothetical protein
MAARSAAISAALVMTFIVVDRLTYIALMRSGRYVFEACVG